jgi:hypothetical protein
VKNKSLLILLLGSVLFGAGCATRQQNVRDEPFAAASRCQVKHISAEVREKILVLDPEHVTEREVRELLSQAPAPQIINIHGGLLPLKGRMTSFAQFLIGMGYPEASIRNPKSGSYTYGYYDNSDKLAGTIAWYYERDGLRPMIVGHSLGGIQAARVLQKLAGNFERSIPVWNPLADTQEPRCEITDPLTGTNRPVVGLQVSYATAAVSGGLARALPGQWDMYAKLREIPDSVEEFTGFQKGFDILGGDYAGYGPANDYHSTGKAIVRNVRLPATSAHLTIPDAQNLLRSPEIRDWIENYHPTNQATDAPGSTPNGGLKNARILWAAEVWYGIKKHWVIELQRLIYAGGSQNYGT